MQMLLPALLQSQPAALWSTTSTPPPSACCTWCNLHSLDSSTFTSGQKSQGNDNWWILKWVFQHSFQQPHQKLQTFYKSRYSPTLVQSENSSIGFSIWTTTEKLRPSMLFGDLRYLAKLLQFLWIQSWLLEQQSLQQLQMKLKPGDPYPAKFEQ